MAAKAATTDLQDVRTLAHKLYVQCRDSSSSLKLLAGSVRKLRNLLEDVEEILDESNTFGPYETRVALQASKCREVLGQLDLAVQQYRCSSRKSNTSNEHAVLNLRLSIEIAVHGLAVAFDALKRTSAIELMLDTSSCSPTPSLSLPSASMSATSSERERNLSVSSSVWTLVHEGRPGSSNETETDTSLLESEAGHQSSDEKEVCVTTDLPASSIVGSSANEDIFIPNWRMPFAVPDPLSIPIQQASDIILKGEQLPRLSAVRSAPSLVAVPVNAPTYQDLPVLLPDSGGGAPDTSEHGESSPSQAQAHSELPAISDDIPDEQDEAGGQESAPGDVRATVEASRGPDTEAIAQSIGIERNNEPSAPPPIPPRNYIAAPPIPPRAPPPPPPPPPRRTRTRAKSESRYHITNLSADNELDEDEEDLYSTSRPTSPSRNLREIAHTRTDAQQSESRDLVQSSPTACSSLAVAPAKDDEDANTLNLPALAVVAAALKVDEVSIVPVATEEAPILLRRPVPRHVSFAPEITLSEPTDAAANDSTAISPRVDVEVGLSPMQPAMVGRRSVDDVLDVRQDPYQPPAPLRRRTVSAPNPALRDIPTGRLRPSPSVVEFYGSRDADEHDPGVAVDVDRERIQHIITAFKDRNWDLAEGYLMGYLESLIEKDELSLARRARHLLGVCASYRGQTDRAMSLFLSVLQKPITNISALDAGDCAAAYWLADSYALNNRKKEALVAYSIAESSSIFQNPAQPQLKLLIAAEQESCRAALGHETHAVQGSSAETTCLLDSSVISTATINWCLQSVFERAGLDAQNTYELNSNKSRAKALSDLHCRVPDPPGNRYYPCITGDMLSDQSTLWPMDYDPLFMLANVARGRLLTFECDLLEVFTSSTEAKVPKSGPVGLGRMECFTCNDLTWLIDTVRQCLKELEMEWSEVANVEGVWFVVRYSFMQKKIATTHYFAIALFKQSWRSAFGLDVCPDGVCSARLIQTSFEHEKGVHYSEPKRIRLLVREYMKQAANRSPQSENSSDAPVVPELEAAAPEPPSNDRTNATSVDAPSPALAVPLHSSNASRPGFAQRVTARASSFMLRRQS